MDGLSASERKPTGRGLRLTAASHTRTRQVPSLRIITGWLGLSTARLRRIRLGGDRACSLTSLCLFQLLPQRNLEQSRRWRVDRRQLGALLRFGQVELRRIRQRIGLAGVLAEIVFLLRRACTR